jgi:hypothetical protein
VIVHKYEPPGEMVSGVASPDQLKVLPVVAGGPWQDRRRKTPRHSLTPA